MRELFPRDVSALRFGRHDRLDELLEWLDVPRHEPLRADAPGGRIFVVGGVAADKRPSVEAARVFVTEGRTLLTSADNVDLAVELAPELAPAKATASWTEAPEAKSWSKPQTGWSRPEPSSWSNAGSPPDPITAPRLQWALGDLEPAWAETGDSFGGDGWVRQGDRALAASVAVGDGRLVHFGGALLSWSTPPAGEMKSPAELGIEESEHDGSPVDERALRVGVTAGALLLELVLAATR